MFLNFKYILNFTKKNYRQTINSLAPPGANLDYVGI